MAVTCEHQKQWGTSTERLWKDAAENVKRILPAEFFTMNYALKEILKKGMGIENGRLTVPENLFGNDSAVRDGMYVLSNKYEEVMARRALFILTCSGYDLEYPADGLLRAPEQRP